MSLTAVEMALLDHLRGAGLNLPIAFQGESFEPDPERAYLRTTFLPADINEAEQETGEEAGIRQTGSYVIMALYPDKAGPGPVRLMADRLERLFKRRQKLPAVAGEVSFTVSLTSTSRGVLLTEDGRNSLPVSVRWLTHRPA
ncbi:phage tail terminator-like protein [Oceanicaulis sp.]|uniref:phage tail terminator-like protein n=1 Tax=Oceanicaulis sp. TaxID=1924941 RepID=UPI003F727D95